MRNQNIDASCYIVQFRPRDETAPHRRWGELNTDAYPFDIEEILELDRKPGWYTHRGFSASGRVWQATGINGTDDLEYAKLVLQKLRRIPELDARHELRLARIDALVRVTPLDEPGSESEPVFRSRRGQTNNIFREDFHA